MNPSLTKPTLTKPTLTKEGMLSAQTSLASKIDGLGKNAPRMFMPLSAMNSHYLDEVAAARSRPALTEFLEWVSEFYSDDKYASIQATHLNPKALAYIRDQGWVSPEIKYLDFPFWAASKLAVAVRQNLHREKRLRVLDIGVGPGHFSVVCNHFDHSYVGLDVPMAPSHPGTRSHVFDDMAYFFRASKIVMTIEAGVPLYLPQKFDRIYCLMGTFSCIRERGKVVRPWNWDEWRFFLNDLLDNSTSPDATMYFQISRSYLPPEVWENIERLAASCNAESNVFVFDGSIRGKV